ncbi:uncharacterized protein LOC110717116 isoform X2 [Chenopodium quinoa]|uniref:uncharacterized protein LOC110717116 isoform X2 n=1 Tax=Chenopodium quinoa TaxID=63459 RepID=UPI000B772964|nr:uncharacterized protein LOC110717116 isoform X2 [Chenopodium quinoa]
MLMVMLEEVEDACYSLWLNKVPLSWGLFPRIKVWSMHEVGLVARLDRKSLDGDFGKMGMLDVAYGEDHPREACDSNGPIVMHNEVAEEGPYTHKAPKARRIRYTAIPCFVTTHCHAPPSREGF